MQLPGLERSFCQLNHIGISVSEKEVTFPVHLCAFDIFICPCLQAHVCGRELVRRA